MANFQVWPVEKLRVRCYALCSIAGVADSPPPLSHHLLPNLAKAVHINDVMLVRSDY